MQIEKFQADLEKAFTFKGPSLVLGGAMLDGQPVKELQVKIPLKTINRHGLIAGATGTGKTKSLQVFAEQLSLAGVPSVVMDIKGDLSGLAQPGSNNKHIVFRNENIGLEYDAQGFPVELMTLMEKGGVRLRSTISEFGPVLLSKMLDLNPTQSSILAVLFKFSDDENLPLLNTSDLKEFLRYVLNEGKEVVQKEYGQLSASSINTILRKIVALEQEGADRFFGEPSFEIEDFIATDKNGRGRISILRLMDIQDKPNLFSTFMLGLLTEIYAKLPEVGDMDRPKMVLFIDEAHLVFRNAFPALLDQIEVIIKLIRSKGVGIYFITQDPSDIPEDVLGQCGLKIQHALRAFTARDRKQIRQTAENFPISEYYDIAESLTQVGLGEALITGLNEKGIPTPVVHTLMRPPLSRMDILTKAEIKQALEDSRLFHKYDRELDTHSAEEILKEKIKLAKEKQSRNAKMEKEMKQAGTKRRRRSTKKEESFFEEMSKNTMVRQVGRTIFRELTRGIMGVLGAK